MATCSDGFYCRDDFDVCLTIFRSYRYSANGTEAVEKIATDEKQMFFINYSLHSHSISITVKKGSYYN